MNKLRHEIFGDVYFEYGWIQNKTLNCWGREQVIQVVIDAEEDAEFESNQVDAYKNFFSNIENLINQAEEKVYEYYQSVCSKYREQLGDEFEDKLAPIIQTQEDVNKIVEPKQILIPMTFDEDIREVGILLECTWEPEHGLAVKFENEQVIEVGYQDIVL